MLRVADRERGKDEGRESACVQVNTRINVKVSQQGYSPGPND